MSVKPKITRYHAMIRSEDGSPGGVHRRASLDATSLEVAKAELEAQYGVGMILSLSGEWESSQQRAGGRAA